MKSSMERSELVVATVGLTKVYERGHEEVRKDERQDALNANVGLHVYRLADRPKFRSGRIKKLAAD